VNLNQLITNLLEIEEEIPALAWVHTQDLLRVEIEVEEEIEHVRLIFSEAPAEERNPGNSTVYLVHAREREST
jgi:hypothetical protein